MTGTLDTETLERLKAHLSENGDRIFDEAVKIDPTEPLMATCIRKSSMVRRYLGKIKTMGNPPEGSPDARLKGILRRIARHMIRQNLRTARFVEKIKDEEAKDNGQSDEGV